MVKDTPITAAEMRALEQEAIASGRVTGLELMERAGQAVVEAIFEQWPKLVSGQRRAVVLCGPGNNGGDGFVVARLLKLQGWRMDIYFYGNTEKLPADARTNMDRWSSLGSVNPFPETRPDPWAPDLIIDAGFGIGLTRPLSDDLIAAFLGCLPESDLKHDTDPPFVVSIDIPTGLCAESGRLMPAAVDPDMTVTFHCCKTGHRAGRGPEFCGKLVVKDIGL